LDDQPSRDRAAATPRLASSAQHRERPVISATEHRAHLLLALAVRRADEAAVTDLRTGPDESIASATVTFDQLELPSGPLAARTARRYLLSCLADVAPDVVDEVLLLTSELVTNAVRHGAAPVRLRLHRRGATLRVDISDGGVRFALTPVPAWSGTAEGGRGLLLVEALATDWGSRDQEDASPGKTVWFELSCGSVAASA
jgi:anti-sigma regulatory factor (Ser/Thr protein kinase)